MDITYCYEGCQIGQTASSTFLALNNSVVDAAIYFECFTKNCFKTCPYISAHENYNNTKETSQ